MEKPDFSDQLKQEISDYLSGNLPMEQQNSLFSYLDLHPDSRKLFHQMSAVHAATSISLFAKQEDENLILLKKRLVQKDLAQKKSLRHIPIWLKIAAVFLLFIASNYLWYLHSDHLTETYTNINSIYKIQSPTGSRANVTLPDGTTVMLNAGSSLSYNRSFGVEKREVSLQGEGYFIVAKNQANPFYVVTKDIRVRVTGTIFNVYAYDDDEFLTVDLLEGGVNLLDENSRHLLSLAPNERAVYSQLTRKIVKTSVDWNRMGEWTKGIMTFDNETFEEIALKLEREYRVKIIVESETLKQERFSGCFSGKHSLEDILWEIDVDKKYVHKVIGNTVIIMNKEKGGN